MNRKLFASCLAVAAATTSLAAADTKSWTAIKGKIPANTAVVLSFDVSALRAGAKEYAKVVNGLIKSEKDVAQVVTMIKSTCALDVTTAVSDVSIAFSMGGKGIISVGLDGGLDEAKLMACANKVLEKQQPGVKITGKPGVITEYSVAGQTGGFFVAWPSKDVFVISTEPDNRPSLETAWKSGKPLTGDLASYATKANGGMAWAAAIPAEPDIKAGYGTLSLAAGTFKGVMHVIPADPKNGEKMLKEAKPELAKEAKKAQKSSKALAKFLRGVKVGGTSADISIEGSISTADVLALSPVIGMMLR